MSRAATHQAPDLAGWYRDNGRHDLPWRHTRDVWHVFVSEVMLQQTPVSRVLPRWQRFVERWPDPASCAAAPLAAILDEWRGLGYPRRAAALHATAAIVAASGWPQTERELRDLPGIGEYTARALLWLTGDAAVDTAPPRDVNVARVIARWRAGVEPWMQTPRQIDSLAAAARPAEMPARDYVLALFDVGALHCRRAPRCTSCPLASACLARPHVANAAPPPPPRRQAAYAGSNRQLRGVLLGLLLDGVDDARAARERLAAAPASTNPGATEAALASLTADGLVTRYDAGLLMTILGSNESEKPVRDSTV